MRNIYFELTKVFNSAGPAVVLASGQAVVFHRVALMSKDGDWVIRETANACGHVLAELSRRGATYRPGAPLDVRWLSAGWSSHFEFFDEGRRRIRCDFFSRPPRVDRASLDGWFVRAGATNEVVAVDVESLIQMKRTQRAKDYPVIGELAARLPPERELELTTNVDRLLDLARAGFTSDRPAARAALEGDRRAVVLALAEETDRLQEEDRQRLGRYERASRRYVEEFRQAALDGLPLDEAHDRLCLLAERLLPVSLEEG